jgi:hypothetical protein
MVPYLLLLLSAAYSLKIKLYNTPSSQLPFQTPLTVEILDEYIDPPGGWDLYKPSRQVINNTAIEHMSQAKQLLLTPNSCLSILYFDPR